ncbi:BrnT family toxin [Paraburkholderia heleia]|uniref:BrnT family toxin n=1 Tax=Paraburkholderia heleia TaxID=634127 RepID=UPI0031D1D4B8
MIYEWDEAKRAANLEKHGLDFADADLVLESEYVLIVDSPRRDEFRQQAFAYVFEALTVLSVAFVPGEDRYRIVSFRPARRDERRAYHDWLENHFDD